ncbi:uncharacterized protein LOC133806571 [Humulus lupulus]|uniref:uncharacterized protein LOC133806571 n=1 Tax=Humulus lupulus TaxID=3486 RepID=UPI002B4075CE|nr:uncharacterized protein LOC133806571 [Humulus lupulus]
MNYENYDPSFPDQHVVDLYLPIWANLPAFRSKPAFIWVEDDSPDGTPPTTSLLTYFQLNNSVQSISSQLLVPLQRGETVVVLCSPGLELVEFIFGCQRAGLLTVPISPPDPTSFPKENCHHLIRVLSQTKPKAAIAHQTYITKVHNFISSSTSKLASLLKNLTWISTKDVKRSKMTSLKFDSLTYQGCNAEEVYLVQYTSGTTGIPKPVLVTAGSAAHNVRTARRAYDLHPNSVIVSWLPQYHDCGLMFLLLTIVSGATCVLTSPMSFVKRPKFWLDLIYRFNASCTPVPSFALPLVIKRGNVEEGRTSSTINLRSLRNLIIINEPIYKSTVEEFVNMFRPFGLNPSSISPSYGLAENCTFVSTSWEPSSSSGHHDYQKAPSFPNYPTHNKLLPSAKLAPLGKSNDELQDMEIVIVNEETLEPVEDGTEGEILVSSPSNASGYLGHPSLTHEVFHGRLSNRVGRCFVRTGDRGIVKGKERFLFVTGRCLDVIKLRNGKEIHPHHIETSAYKTCSKFLRGGCLAAFKVGEVIALVGEVIIRLSDERENSRVLMRICEGLREGVMKVNEGIEVGLVVLVKSGCVPKTTSGKVQRWATKQKLIGGGMSVVMEMSFGGEGNRGVLEGKEIVKESWEEAFDLSLSSPSNRLLLMSFL